MEHLNLFVAQIAVLFLPGIIWARIDMRYAAKEKRSDLDFFIATFIFGLVAYSVTFVGYAAAGRTFRVVDFKAVGDTSVLTSQVCWEILIATAVGFVLGSVDKMPDPKADAGDENEAKITVRGLIVAGGQASTVLEF